jgi:hypothetical protein
MKKHEIPVKLVYTCDKEALAKALSDAVRAAVIKTEKALRENETYGKMQNGGDKDGQDL